MSNPDPSEQRSEFAQQVQQVIAQAYANSTHNQRFSARLRAFSRQTGHWRTLNGGTLDYPLSQFILDYTDLLPDYLRQFQLRCQRGGLRPLYAETEQVLSRSFAEADRAAAESGLAGLLDRIYFAHRLLEELHDQLRPAGTPPWFPWDMTLANLLVHQILGSPLCFRLDQLAYRLARQLTRGRSLSATPLQAIRGPASAWPCFCRHYGIELSLTD